MARRIVEVLANNPFLRVLRTSDRLFFFLALSTCLISFLVPFLQHPVDPSNPWPYAYNVIQSQIIASGHFQNPIPQFGEFVRLDYGWFVVNHLVIVTFSLATGLTFESQERILSIMLSLAFFVGFYQFIRQFFGNAFGFATSFFFLFIPRTYNYLANVNGEFLAWLILFPALVAFIAFVKVERIQYAILSCFLASALVIANLVVFGEYLLIVGSYVLARMVLLHDVKRLFVRLSLILVLTLILVPLPVLITSGDLVPGSSSTIGSLYSSKSPIEVQYENQYYQNYDYGWKDFASKMPVQVQLYYLADDGDYSNYFLPFMIPFALIGLVSCILNPKKITNLFALLWFGASLSISSLLLSPLFNATVVAGSVRLLLYFSWPLSLMAGVGLIFVWSRLRHAWTKVGICLLLALLVVGGTYADAASAGLANSQPRLYLHEYQAAFDWLRANSSPFEVVVMNDWTVGQVWMKSSRLSTTEGVFGSASYSTYQQIVTKFNDAKTILASPSMTETISLLQKYNISWILLWNRPSAIGLVPYEQINFSKFDNSSTFTKVFYEQGTYSDIANEPFPPGDFTAKVVIYHVNVNRMIPQEATDKASGQIGNLIL